MYLVRVLGEKSDFNVVMRTLKKKRGRILDDTTGFAVLESRSKAFKGVGDFIILKKGSVGDNVIARSISLTKTLNSNLQEVNFFFISLLDLWKEDRQQNSDSEMIHVCQVDMEMEKLVHGSGRI